MIINLLDLPKPPQPVTITTGTRSIQIRNIAGEMIHCEPGTTITIERETLAKLDPSDWHLASDESDQ